MNIKSKKSFIDVYLFFSLSMLLVCIPLFSYAAEWRYEGIAYYAPIESEDTKPIYRFYSENHKAYFYTMSESEKNRIIAKYPEKEWKYEGIAYHVPKISSDDTQPVYRFYSPKYRTHFFTKSESEKNTIIKKYPTTEWRYENIAYHIPKASSNDTQPVYRFYNTIHRAHFFTASENEKNNLIAGDLGPLIAIGLHEYTESTLENESFRLRSEKDYVVKNKNGTVITTIPANAETRVKYLNDSDHTFRIYNSIPEITATDEITFESADGNQHNIIFNIDQPDLQYTQYRGKIKLRYSNNNSKKRIWVINQLPLEHYIWGMGEITGTGPMEYNKVMTTAYRTYGYWKILYSTAYAVEGFDVNATPGNQLYRGYEWEKRYPRIRQAAETTRGKIVKHGSDIALTPYSSWTDGRTRSFEERWGSKLYPWCQSVSDPYGDYNGDYWDNSTQKSTNTLIAEGNHMVGISAHGALSLANDEGWQWDKILKYYLDDITITNIY